MGDTKTIQGPFQSGERLGSVDEDGKNRPQKVLAFQKNAGIWLSGILMQTGTAVCQAHADWMSDTNREKEQNVGGRQKKGGLWKDKLGGDVNPAKFAKEGA